MFQLLGRSSETIYPTSQEVVLKHRPGEVLKRNFKQSFEACFSVHQHGIAYGAEQKQIKKRNFIVPHQKAESSLHWLELDGCGLPLATGKKAVTQGFTRMTGCHTISYDEPTWQMETGISCCF